MENKMTHFDQDGNAVMVDVSEKNVTERTAVASGKIKVSKEVMDAILNQSVKKGDVLSVAQIAGIMGAKKTSELIPLCHLLSLQKCGIQFEIEKEKREITAICTVKTTGKTGVEMEALTAVQVGLLTIYDMLKAVDRGMVMTDIHLQEKSGGQSGHWISDK